MREETEFRNIPNVVNEDDDTNEPSFLQQILYEVHYISELEPKPLYKNAMISQSSQLIKKSHNYSVDVCLDDTHDKRV